MNEKLSWKQKVLQAERRKLQAVQDKIARGSLKNHAQAAGLAVAATAIARRLEILLTQEFRC